jgi:hypothetical protein
MSDEERQLWRIGDLECFMITCCAGAELQLRRVRLKPGTSEDRERDTTEGREPEATEDREIVLRELYPTKSDLYERARDLRLEHEATGFDRK